MSPQRLGWMFVVLAMMSCSCAASAQEQYPKPLIHTPTNHPAAHILVLSIEGLHAFDLASFVATHPHSALAELTLRGVTYTNAQTPVADPVAGLVSLVTGGTPISTGILSSDGYDHALSPPESECKTTGASIALSASQMPRDPRHGCVEVPPHALLRVNTMFEVVHEKVGTTAWAGESAAITDLLAGPSGQGLDDRCAIDRSQTDEDRVRAVLHWIDGRDCADTRDMPVPALFGMNFTALVHRDGVPAYLDAYGTPSAFLLKALKATDSSIARVVAELKTKHLYDSTWIAVTSPYGLSPIDPRQLRVLPLSRLRAAANAVKPGLAVHVAGGDIAMVWLSDATKTEAVAKAYNAQASALGIQAIHWGTELALTLNDPAKDTRMPDLILQPQPGVVWSNGSHVEDYGGRLEADTHVALLVSGTQLTGRFDPTLVPTTQLAPLLLRALGMEKFDLQALHQEHSPALPGIF